MKQPSKKPDRMWRASLLKKRAEFLGIVWEPDRAAAEVAVIEAFKLDFRDWQRLVI
jgi:hypothetical protein